MSFTKITKKYLQDFQKSVALARSTGAKSIELATRPVVHGFIEAIADHCKNSKDNLAIHHDTNYTNKDRPDWRIEDAASFGVFCFGDHKSLSASGPFQPTAAEQKQIARYLALGRPVFVFDGIEFIFYRGNISSAVRCQLIPKPLSVAAVWADETIDITAETQFRNLLQNPGFRKWTEKQLIEQLATRARSAADEIASLLSAPLGSGSSIAEEELLATLHVLRKMIADHHDPSLRDDKACADFVAQVLTFGLFYAHTRHTKLLANPAARETAIRDFWSSETLATQPDLLRPFKAIVSGLSASLSSTNMLSDWYEEILGVLAHAEYMGTAAGPQDYHALFEQFLTTFDEQARFDRGAFYTPRVLTNWIAATTDRVSQDTFGSPIMEAAEKIIDPCCGTGGFLEAVYALRSPNPKKQADLVGFEILPAPYALAHYRMAELFDGDHNPPNLKVILTDTLADQLLGPIGGTSNGFEEELNDAISLSYPPLRLVIGNPPSSNHAASSAARKIIEAKLDVFRPPKLERTDRQNIQKALNNEAYRFLRWCGEKASESGRGILSLVLPGAFARAVSFQYARKWLLSNFNKIYILEVDGDARTNDATHSIFSVLQGRLVLIAVKTGTDLENIADVLHDDITALRLEDKCDFMERTRDLTNFVKIEPTEPQWRFAPTLKFPVALWDKGWPLLTTKTNVGIFLQKCSAVKLAPTAMLFHTQENILLRRSIELSKSNLTTEFLLKKWFSGQRKPPNASKLTPLVKVALKDAANRKDTAPYLFRPFVHGTFINSNQVFDALKSTEGGGVRDRPEVRSAFQAGAIGIAVAPAPSDLGATLTRFACFAWNIPDNDIAARGNAMIYCDRFAKKSSLDKSVLSDNVTEDLRQWFNFSSSPTQDALFYVYAMLSTPSYLDTFEGVLFAPSDPSAPTRILISSDEGCRKKLSELGKSIAECERSDYQPSVQSSLLTSWPDGVTEIKLAKWSYDEVNSVLKLSGENGEAVLLTGVPQQAVELRIAGHTVMDKWLRERTYAYLTKTFTHVDSLGLEHLIRSICDQEALISAADSLVKNIIDQGNVIPPTIVK